MPRSSGDARRPPTPVRRPSDPTRRPGPRARPGHQRAGRGPRPRGQLPVRQLRRLPHAGLLAVCVPPRTAVWARRTPTTCASARRSAGTAARPPSRSTCTTPPCCGAARSPTCSTCRQRPRPPRPDPTEHVPRCGRARRHPQPTVLGGPGAGRDDGRGDEGGAGRRRLAGHRPQDLRVAAGAANFYNVTCQVPARQRSACSAYRRRRGRADRRRLGSARHARHRVAHPC